MLYKKGDKVVVKPWAMMEAQYGLDCDGDIKTKDPDGDRCTFMKVQNNKLIASRIVRIERIGDGRYYTDSSTYSFCDDMFLGLHFELGEKIEVSDNGEDWSGAEFWGYRFGPESRQIINVKRYTYNYARPIQPKLTIRVEMNGKAVDPKELSDESWMALRK